MEKNTVLFRFYEELNDFLPLSRRKVWFEYCLDGSPAVGDLISSLGVAHTQVDLILVNGESVDFSRRVKNGDRISVYPVFESLDISEVTHLRPEPLRKPKFILSGDLGQLANYLQRLGFDVIHQQDYTKQPNDPKRHGYSNRHGHRKSSIIRIAESSNRILLTRNKELFREKTITRGYLIRAVDPMEQLAEVMSRFDLFSLAKISGISHLK